MPPPRRRRGATIGFVYHASVQQQNVEPKDGIQKLGTWCSPPDEGDEANAKRAAAGDPDECDDTTGAPTVAATVSVKLSAGEADEFATWEDAFLRVRFGSGEIDDQILELDLMNGVSFPLIARNAIFEIVYPIVKKAGETYQPKIDVQVSIGVGVLGSSGARGARRTVLIGDLGNADQGGSSAPFLIPPFAVGAVYASADATATATLAQVGSIINGLPVLAVNTIEKFEYRSVPVRHGARAAVLTTAAQSLGNAVIFYLSPA
jgi:hypothetical protein